MSYEVCPSILAGPTICWGDEAVYNGIWTPPRIVLTVCEEMAMSKMNTPHKPAPDRPTLKPGAKDGIGKPLPRKEQVKK